MCHWSTGLTTDSAFWACGGGGGREGVIIIQPLSTVYSLTLFSCGVAGLVEVGTLVGWKKARERVRGREGGGKEQGEG